MHQMLQSMLKYVQGCQTPWRLKQKKRHISGNLVPSRPKTPFYAQAPAKHALIYPGLSDHWMAETDEKTSFYCSSKTFSGLFILKLHHILWKTGMNEYRQSILECYTLPRRKTFPVHLPELSSDDSFFGPNWRLSCWFGTICFASHRNANRRTFFLVLLSESTS